MFRVKNFLSFQTTYLMTPIHTAIMRHIITKMYIGMTVPVIDIYLHKHIHGRWISPCETFQNNSVSSFVENCQNVYGVSCVFLTFPFSLDCAFQQLITIRPQLCHFLCWFLRHKLYHTKSFMTSFITRS